MVDLFSIFKAARFAYAAAQYFGFVADKLSLKLDDLSASEFESGIRALQQASRSETEQSGLLREARYRLNKAVSLEKGLRLATAHLGLAICHYYLGDRVNAKASLEDVIRVPVGKEQKDSEGYKGTIMGAHFDYSSDHYRAFYGRGSESWSRSKNLGRRANAE